MREPVFAGRHSLNGNGEMTGLEWVRESGLLTSPIAITNTHSVGVVRDALGRRVGRWERCALVAPGRGRDVRRAAQRHEWVPRHAGPIFTGRSGGGARRTGRGRQRSVAAPARICHEFKGGIGTASRVIPTEAGGYTVGVLVQSNYGKRAWLRVDGVRGRRGDPGHGGAEPVRRAPPASRPAGSGSIIVVVATDAPLLPHQCERLAQRAGLGIARVGGTGGHTSGDLFIAFATGNRIPTGPGDDEDPIGLATYAVRAVGDITIDKLFDAVIEATEEAIVNALVAATTVVGRDGITAHAIPHDRLVEVMRVGRSLTVDHRAGPARTRRASPQDRHADPVAPPGP